MKPVLVGPQATKRQIQRISKDAAVIAVDGGLDVLWLARCRPEFAIGDWDSLKKRSLLKDVDHFTLPVKKDRNDLYYGLTLARGLDFPIIECIGFLGGRRDHEVSNYLEFARFVEENPQTCVKVIGETETLYWLSHNQLSLTLRKSQVVSIFSMGSEDARKVSLKGFEYALRGARLSRSSQGLSNVARSKVCSVSVGQGVLMVMVNHERSR